VIFDGDLDVRATLVADVDAASSALTTKVALTSTTPSKSTSTSKSALEDQVNGKRQHAFGQRRLGRVLVRQLAFALRTA
jgi:hypothetical protein